MNATPPEEEQKDDHTTSNVVSAGAALLIEETGEVYDETNISAGQNATNNTNVLTAKNSKS